jgi:hypothetical protein
MPESNFTAHYEMDGTTGIVYLDVRPTAMAGLSPVTIPQ